MKWPFGKKQNSAADIINGASWECVGCGQTHSGLPDLAALAPDNWTFDRTYEPNSNLRMDGDFLSEDFCVINGTTFAVRCVLPIPIVGMDKEFCIGCWGSLARENFSAYVEHFDSGKFSEVSGWFSWLLNDLKPWMEGKAIACNLATRPDRQRPYLFVQDDNHALAQAQDNGMTPEQILRLFAAYGHEIGN